MTAVTIQPGAYWLGNPKLVDPKWVESPTFTYTLNGKSYHAFRYHSGPVAAIPMAALPEDAWETVTIVVQPEVVASDEVSVTLTKPKGKKSVAEVVEPPKTFTREVRRLKTPFANTLTTFEEETLFYENHGNGKIGGIAL